MNVTKIDSRTVKTYVVSIEDGEIRPQPYSSSGREYRVASVTVVKREGNVSSVELRGQVLKKDGTEGANPARESIWEREWPQWLRSIVGGLA